MPETMVFTITTGRSGTGFLAHLLACVPRVTAVHEGEPDFVSVMRDVQDDPGLARRFWLERKLPAIERLTSDGSAYVETSHLFCKGFVEPLLDLGVVPNAIVLHREQRKVALSMLQLGTVPGRSEKALTFYLAPTDPVLLPLSDPDALTDYQLCYWYTLEVAARAERYEALIREAGGRVVHTDVERASTRSGFSQLLSDLGLPSLGPLAWARFLSRRGRAVNTKSDRKESHPLAHPSAADELDRLEREVREGVAPGR